MLLKLQPYDLDLIHVSGKSLGLADCLSRMPVGKPDHLMDDDLMVCVADTMASRWAERIQVATQNDDDLQVLTSVILQGWPEARAQVPTAATPFWDVRDQLSVYEGVIYRGDRICIPRSLRAEILKLLHRSHGGIVKTKQLAREKVYWPGLNHEIEELVSKCETCQLFQNRQTKEPLTPHEIPARPWSKVGTDLFELHSQHYIVLVDYYSNFIELENLEGDTTARNVIRKIKQSISRFGIMDTLISDNGPQYNSAEFMEFTRCYKIQHVTSSPGYPEISTNCKKFN